MRAIVELTEEEVEVLKLHLVFRMQWIGVGMDEKEPLDFVLAKIYNAFEPVGEEPCD